MNTQADLERQLAQRQLQVDAEMMTLEQAFGTLEDWIIELGGRKAFLHPQFKQWMWYSSVHDEWQFAECGVDEGILLTIGSLGGVKKLPQTGNVADWCIYMLGESLAGPLLVEDLRQMLDSGESPSDMQVWSTRATNWLTADSEEAQKIIFSDPSEDATILRGA